MKEFSVTYTISGIYNDNNNIYDLKKYKFLDGTSLDNIEDELALWILLFDSDNITMDMVHTDMKEDGNMEDDDEYSLGATG